MTQFFEFEADFVASLRCIPMIVRFKLDTCAVKLKLHHWHNFNQLEKEILVNKPCETPEQITEYRQYLRDLVYKKTGEYPQNLAIDQELLWLKIDSIPINIQKKAQEFDFELTLSHWKNLQPLQRFALIKLSRPSHENNNFIPALKEFNLL